MSITQSPYETPVALTLDLSNMAEQVAARVAEATGGKAVLTANEAAELLGVTRNTFTRYCREVEGFPARRLGGRWLVNRAALLRWLADTEAAQKTKAPHHQPEGEK